jgi:hypothetical protein
MQGSRVWQAQTGTQQVQMGTQQVQMGTQQQRQQMLMLRGSMGLRRWMVWRQGPSRRETLCLQATCDTGVFLSV